MAASITISKELPKDSALSYDFLREEGIKLIQQMAGDSWTDHNTHDPGITILEQVCYAITDLAYRVDYDIKDVLGSDESSSYTDLYSPATILTVNPVTLLDLRKVVMDVAGVKNAWVEKVSQENLGNATEQESLVPKGLYRVFIEKDELSDSTGSKIVADVKSKLQACRAVGEDFEEIKILNPQSIRLHGTIEIADTVDDVNQLVAYILDSVGSHLSPRIPFYTLQQLLEEGKRTDEIFEGPVLVHGFINDKELLQHKRKKEIQTSDVIREIMDQAGILAIDNLSLATGTDQVKSWILPLDPTKTPTLDVDGTLERLSFTSQGLKVNIDIALVKTLYNEKRKEGLPKKLAIAERDITMPETKDRQIENYYSFQNQFSSNYGIGNIGLPDSTSPERKAQAKQLTAYLTFFEQLLANHFSQVANFKKLMSFDTQDIKTYFNQSLLGKVSGLEEVLVHKESYLEYLDESTVDTATGLQRKNKFLNHLLARFSEQFTGYGMLLQQDANDADTSDPNAAAKKLITDKANFLQDYPLVSAGRAKGYDYTQQHWQSKNISGLEQRIARKLGIEDYSRRNLGDGNTEGLHMVDHILLRPRAAYPYPFSVNYSADEISAFEEAENTANTRCIAKAHTLKIGEEIQILENENYEGTYKIIAVGEDNFEIEESFKAPTSGATWQRTQDIRYFVATETVVAFLAAASGSNHTFCKVYTHSLQDGDQIEITETQHYDGIYNITNVTEDGFEIPIPFSNNETAGRWMPLVTSKDPYSFQLTFVLPNWMERYQNDQLKKFVENTIREETPAHLTPYIKWLDKNEMQGFDKAFYTFLEVINRS